LRLGEYFPLPEALTRTSGARIMGLDDPTAKMSKSTAETHPGHAINLLDDADTVRKTIMRAVTDTGSEVRFEFAGAGVKNLLTLYEVLSGETRSTIETKFAGKGYGYLKRDLVEVVLATLEPIQRKYRHIISEPGYLDDLLAVGAGQARAIAERTIAEVRQKVGI
jgi:tryptophanyl-tRNA synthetase